MILLTDEENPYTIGNVVNTSADKIYMAGAKDQLKKVVEEMDKMFEQRAFVEYRVLFESFRQALLEEVK